MEVTMPYIRYVVGQEPHHIKHPATRQDGKCWLDEPESTASGPGGYN